MKQTRWIMGMPISISIVATAVKLKIIEDIFNYFHWVDSIFSTYKKTSEISQINAGRISLSNISSHMQEIFLLAERTKKETFGYFDIYQHRLYDPSGVVKGWAIQNSSMLLRKKGYKHFYIDAGGDIQTSGHNEKGTPWIVGIRNPFNTNQIVKSLQVTNAAVATSGVYIRGHHIYNPFFKEEKVDDIASLTVIGRRIVDADRFATAAFAMGKRGIRFIEQLSGFEGYMIDSNGIATYTSGFDQYIFDSFSDTPGNKITA